MVGLPGFAACYSSAELWERHRMNGNLGSYINYVPLGTAPTSSCSESYGNDKLVSLYLFFVEQKILISYNRS